MFKSLMPILILMALYPSADLGAAPRIGVAEQRCEYLLDPVGIDVRNPHLSWELEARDTGARGLGQSAYRILVASDPGRLASDAGDLWDSGRVESDQSTLIAYGGKPLESGMDCFWKVCVWDGEGQSSGWSPNGRWSMGLLDPDDWKASWIGLERASEADTPADQSPPSATFPPARYLRREFDLSRPLRKAVVSFSALGNQELHINGHRVGDQVLDPAYTDSLKQVFYTTHEVGSLLHSGRNAIGIVMGNGRSLPLREAFPSYGFPKAICQLHLEYGDGFSEWILSDGSWRLTTEGPIRENQEYDGETQDARLDLGDWDRPGYDDSRWIAAEEVSPPEGSLRSQMIEPMRVTETLHPVAITSPTPEAFLFDLGQNIVGWAQLKASGPAGTRIELRHAETLDAKGMLDVRNLRSARAQDVFILKGEGLETFEPAFTYHGFRYVEVRGFPGRPDLATLEGKVVHTDVEKVGTFSCSDPLINRIHRNMVWGIRGNLRSIPTDCPQRDERQGWLGDIAIESKGESYEFGVARFFLKWLEDIQLAQTEEGSLPDVAPPHWKVRNDDVTWPSTYLIIPGWFYDHSGDRRVLEQHYPSMKRWIVFMNRFLAEGLMPRDEYGDWCVPPEDPALIHSKDPNRKTPGEFLGTAYFYHDLRLLAGYAEILGKPGDAEDFEAQAVRMLEAFNRKFFHPETNLYANGTQTSSVLPLAFQMVPPGHEEAVFKNLVDDIVLKENMHLGTGLIGCQWLMRVLSQYGRPDVALGLLRQTTYPSWGYMAEHGATTIWELWNGDTADPGMNSHNHLMLIGDLGVWLYEGLAGIQPDPEAPGFKHFSIRPQILEGLSHVEASTDTSRGRIGSRWSRTGDSISLEVVVPVNSRATVGLPVSSDSAAVVVTESGAPVWKGNAFVAGTSGISSGIVRGDRIELEVGSGTYRFDLRPE